MDTTRIIALAQDMARAFETRSRDNGDRFDVLQDDRPDWMQDVCREAHGDMLPDDQRYAMIRSAVEAIAEADNDSDLEDIGMELDADIYTHDLTAWLHSRVDRYAYVDIAIEERGPFDSIIGALQAGQYEEKREVFALVLRALSERADDLDLEEQTT